MSAITIGGDLVHYEDLGRGKPIILLHSWLGSWRYWIPAMQQLSVSKYRTYALDLWGFGDSGKTTINTDHYYSLDNQVNLLHEFLEKMGIAKAVFVGHGLGAAVVARYAAHPQHGQKVHRLAVISPPLFDTGPLAPKPLALTANTVKPATESQPEPLTGAITGASTPPLAMPTPDAATIPSMTVEERRKLLEQVALAAAQKSQGTSTGAGSLPPLPSALPIPTPTPTPTTSSEAKPSPSLPTPLTSEQMKPPPATPPKEEKAEPEQSLLKKDPLLEIFAEDIQKLLGKHVDISSSDYEKLKSEVAKTDPVAVTTVCRNVHTYRELMGIEIPTLILTGIQDTLMKLSDEKLREQLRTRKQLALVEFEGIRHFPMLEDTAKFTRLLRDFMELPDVENLQVKEEWRRRTR